MFRTHGGERSSRTATACLYALSGVVLAVLWTSGCRKPPVEGPSHFALRGLHAPLTCSQCHGGQLTTLPTHCSGCHEPDRPASHYAGECSECHTEDGWGTAVVDHGFFPLEFGHDGPQCLDCHTEGDDGDVSPVCESCHLRPSGHQEGPCDVCHTIVSWDDAEIDHSFFPLSLGHSGLTCVDCHDHDDYAAADPTCTSCHTRPSGHFQGACDDCHTTRDWEADFDHDQYFPVPHEGEDDCADCHLSAGSGNYSTFSCIDCHEHRRSEMDDEHLGEVDDYVYQSAACLDCHPNGEEEEDD